MNQFTLDIVTVPIQAQALSVFFEQLRTQLHKGYFVGELPQFFEKLRVAMPEKEAAGESKKIPYLYDLGILKEWLEGMEEPLKASRRGGLLCDPWEIAGIRRDEVRNTRILAWLLDPNGSHGFGDLLLTALLEKINGSSLEPSIPTNVGLACRVRTESSPDGNGANRLDIEVDAEFFYLIIEVKIDAIEGAEQLERYSRIAEARASIKNRPWNIVYLTPNGRPPKTAAKYVDKIFSLSWQEASMLFSRALRKIKLDNQLPLRAQERLTQLLAFRFLEHVRNF